MSASLKSAFTMNVNRSTYIKLWTQSLNINWQPSTLYSFVVNSGFVTDQGGKPSAQQTIFYLTNTAPSITSTNPAVGSSNVINNASIILTFNRTIYAGTGNFYLYQLGGTLLKTFSATTGVTISNNIVTLNVKGLLASGTTYYLMTDSQVIKDTDKFYWAGYTTTTAFRYTTAGEPAFPDLIAIESSQSRLTCLAGKLLRLNSALSSTSRLTSNITRVTPGRASLSSSSTLVVSGQYIPKLTLVSRNYTGNTITQLISGDQYSYHDTTNTYTVTMSSPGGQFGTSSAPISNYTNNSYQFSGSYSAIKNQLNTTWFWPTKNYSSNTTYTVTITTNDGISVTASNSLNWSGWWSGAIYTFNYNSNGFTWSPTSVEMYYASINYTIVGAGGGGDFSGGGGGQVIQGSYSSITQTTYNVYVGKGGHLYFGVAAAESSSFNNITALGGHNADTNNPTIPTRNPDYPVYSDSYQDGNSGTGFHGGRLVGVYINGADVGLGGGGGGAGGYGANSAVPTSAQLATGGTGVAGYGYGGLGGIEALFAQRNGDSVSPTYPVGWPYTTPGSGGNGRKYLPYSITYGEAGQNGFVMLELH